MSAAPTGPIAAAGPSAAEPMDDDDDVLGTWCRRPSRRPSLRAPARRIVENDDDSRIVESDDDSNAISSSAPQHYTPLRIESIVFADYNAQHMGRGVEMSPPLFLQGSSDGSVWQSYDQAGEGAQFRPVRTMVYNVPIDLFSRDSQRFHNWNTTHSNSTRGTHIAAILGMAFTGTSKGFLSGDHEELKRANGQADEDAEAVYLSRRYNVSRVFRYAFVDKNDNNVTVPMFVIAYQELYNPDLSEIVAVRVWKFVFDKNHSDSELWRRLMDENCETFCSSGVAHARNAKRKRNLLQEHHEYVRAITGNTHGKLALEYFAGTQYTRVTNETRLMDALRQYSGKNIHLPLGLPSLDWHALPPLVTTKRIAAHPEIGGSHPLAPEYVFNARREQALRAGLVDFSGHAIDVHPDYLKPDFYFSESGDFRVPGVDRSTGGFFLCIDSTINNIFELALPRPLYSRAGVGEF